MVSELPQREITLRGPSAALENLQLVVKFGSDLPWLIAARSLEPEFKAVFLKAMDLDCRHKGNDPQIIIDTVYDVRPPPLSPEV